MFVHADDINTHEQFFNFTKKNCIQTKQISLRFDLMYMHCRPIEKNNAQFTYATKIISFAIKKSDHI